LQAWIYDTPQFPQNALEFMWSVAFSH